MRRPMRSAEPISLTSTTPSLPQRPNGERYRRRGGVWTMLGSRKNSKPEKCLKMPPKPRRPVHAVLAGFLVSRLILLVYNLNQDCKTKQQIKYTTNQIQ